MQLDISQPTNMQNMYGNQQVRHKMSLVMVVGNGFFTWYNFILKFDVSFVGAICYITDFVPIL